MTTENGGPKDLAGLSVNGAVLRRRAEEKARAMKGRELESLSPEEGVRLLHELRVHQIELEMQNDELRRAQEELEASRARYFDLYDLAPVGYFTLSEHSSILEANLTAATLLGLSKGELCKMSVTRFILPDHQDIYYRHRKRLFETGEPQVFEIRVLRLDGTQFWARIEAHAVQDEKSGAPVCRAVMIDITERKREEEALHKALAKTRQRESEMRLLLEASHAVLQCHTFEESARRIFDACRKATGAVSGYVALISASGEENEVLFLESGGMPCEVDPELPMPIRGLRAEAYKKAAVVYENDFMKSRWAQLMPPGHVRMRNVIFAPLTINGKVVGVMGLANKPMDFTEDDARIAAAFGDIAAIALDRTRVEEALSRSEEKFSLAFQTSPYSIAITRAGDGGFIEVNDAFTSITGFTREEAFANSSIGLRLWADEEDRKRVVSALLEGRAVAGQEFRFRKKNDEIFTGLVSAQVFQLHNEPCILSSLNDITARKRMEEALRESEARHRSFVELTEQLGWTTNADGEVVEDMPSWREFTGQSEEEISGWGWSKALHPQDLEHTVRAWKSAVAEKKNYEVEYRIRRYDGVYRHFLVRGVPVLKGDGDVHEWVGTCIDITERREMEQEIGRAKDELELRVHERTRELERRNQELQEFVFVASHDLSEPLRKIQTFGSLLEERSADLLGEQERDYISRMTGAANRMQNLLDSLLRYSRIATRGQKFRQVKLDDVVRDATSDLNLAIQQARGRVEAASLPKVSGDHEQLRQLFQNLIANALTYRQAGLDPVVKIHSTKNRKLHRIFVEDNGIGFDEKYVEKIFQPFQRLHGRNEYSGTGIGLAICRKIVERHGGTITAKSTPGQGSTFIVTLPVEGAKAMNERYP